MNINTSILSFRVEFNSKFYDGQGYKFHPFSFDDLSEYSIED